MLWNGIEDLKLLIIDLNNSLKKRVELASKATADLLNNSEFVSVDRSNAWPVVSVALAIARGDVCFSKLFLTAGHNPFSPPPIAKQQHSHCSRAATTQYSTLPSACCGCSTPKSTVLCRGALRSVTTVTHQYHPILKQEAS